MDISDLFIECCYLPENSFTLLLGDYHDHTNYLHCRRVMDLHEIILVKRGTLYMDESGIRYPLSEGSILFLEAGKEHGGYKSAEVVFYCIHFNADQLIHRKAEHLRLLARIQPEASGQQAFCIPKYARLNNAEPIYSAFNACLMQSQRKELYSTMRYFSGFLNLTSLILDDVILPTDIESEVDPSLGKVQKMMNFIKNTAMNQPSAREVAREVRLNPDYANRLFKKVQGCSIQEYLLRTTCERAKEFLKEPSLTVAEVAYKTGFNDPYYFSRIFKKKTGISPRNFRKQVYLDPVRKSV